MACHQADINTIANNMISIMFIIVIFPPLAPRWRGFAITSVRNLRWTSEKRFEIIKIGYIYC